MMEYFTKYLEEDKMNDGRFFFHSYKAGWIKWSDFSAKHNQYWYNLNVNTHAVLHSDLENKRELKSNKICWYYKDYLTSKEKSNCEELVVSMSTIQKHIKNIGGNKQCKIQKRKKNSFFLKNTVKYSSLNWKKNTRLLRYFETGLFKSVFRIFRKHG